MTEKQEQELEKIESVVIDGETTIGICELIMNEAQAENPTEREALFAYGKIRVLTNALFDRLTREHKQLETAFYELHEAIKNGR